MFISIDGCDGSGKGRQIEFLKSWFNDIGLDFVSFRDPGDTQLGENLRSLILNHKNLSICPKSELALFMASRAQLVEEKIKPSLIQEKTVLLDRYLLSTVVYQGYAAGVSDQEINQIWDMCISMTSNVLPDITIVLDCPTDIAFKRLHRTRDRIESKGYEFHTAVSEGYRKAAANWGKRSLGQVFLIDATASPQSVFKQIQTILQDNLLCNFRR